MRKETPPGVPPMGCLIASAVSFATLYSTNALWQPTNFNPVPAKDMKVSICNLLRASATA